MNLILCHPFDRDAIWLYLELKKRGTPVQLLAPEQILMSKEWTQTLDSGGDDFVVSTQDGLSLKNGEIDFVFNRMQFVDAPVWRRVAEAEREYVRSEMSALMMSWLYQVQQKCPMINPPVGSNLCGVGWSKAEWAKTAFDAGFREAAVSGLQPANDERVLVVGGKVLSRLKDRNLAQRCIVLAQMAHSPLLEISVRDDGSTFTGATAFPAFRAYGEKFLALLHHQLNWKDL